jgi:CheY-like chemotaxis protein
MARLSTVLLVASDPTLRARIAGVLSLSGFNVLLAADGPDALQIVAKQPVEVLFTDCTLAGMDGLDLAEQAKAVRPSLRVLYLVERAGQANAGRGPFGRVVHKPCQPAEIVAEIRKALEESPDMPRHQRVEVATAARGAEKLSGRLRAEASGR